MNQDLNTFLQLFLRWIHIVAGVIWIGHLYFFNWVNGPFQTKIDGPTKKLVNPELMPRALYWFRWGAAWTWFSGILLAALIYYHEKTVLFENGEGNQWLWLALVLVLLAVGFVLYNFIMKALANKVVAAAICLVLFAGVYAVLEFCGKFGGRALYIHAGAIFGTMMALNVWMVIWPNQKKILTALKNGTPLAPDSPEVKIAGLRSRHNTYMSVPLIFLMISNHYPTMFSNPMRDACLASVIILGFFVTWLLYKKSGKVAGF
ncbi:MAG TPA: urate hydroxylase PuuD [Thermoanaerobaculia bacterium]|nr:urate hydroxylase PuuD [Thermoanaerobaculia bacterium]